MRPRTPVLPPAGGNPREVAVRLNAVISGKINSLGTVTLNASSASTVLEDLNIGLESVLLFSPMSANAQLEGSPWFQITQRGQATLNHANSAQTDRTFGYVVLG